MNRGFMDSVMGAYAYNDDIPMPYWLSGLRKGVEHSAIRVVHGLG